MRYEANGQPVTLIFYDKRGALRATQDGKPVKVPPSVKAIVDAGGNLHTIRQRFDGQVRDCPYWSLPPEPEPLGFWERLVNYIRGY